MAAVFRLKRRLDEEPSETLLINCKKRKTECLEQNEDDKLSAVLKFAGTVKEEENILQHIKKHTIDDVKCEFKKHSVDIQNKLRNIKQQDSKNSRYKIVNRFRSPDLDDTEKEANKSDYTIYDIETDLNENDENLEDKNLQSGSQSKYVYDLYYTSSDDLGDANLEEYVHVCPIEDPLVFPSVKDNGLNEGDSDNDSEDSNAENCWRNDYPDESDMESVDEDDMVEAMNNVAIEEDLLSSDSGEEGFVYSIDSEGAGFEEDVDEDDVQRYGERYARFKSRNKDVETATLAPDFYYGDIDEEDYYY